LGDRDAIVAIMKGVRIAGAWRSMELLESR
jgi:hypothetical protein